MKSFKNKKGSLVDLVFLIAILLVLSISVLIGLRIAGGVNTQIQSMAGVSDEAKDASAASITKYTYTINNVFLILTIGITIAILALAALVSVHPIFIPFFIIGWFLLVFVAGITSDIYVTMANDPNLIATAASLNLIGTIMAYLPIIIGVIGVLLMVVMYKISAWAQ